MARDEKIRSIKEKLDYYTKEADDEPKRYRNCYNGWMCWNQYHCRGNQRMKR